MGWLVTTGCFCFLGLGRSYRNVLEVLMVQMVLTQRTWCFRFSLCSCCSF